MSAGKLEGTQATRWLLPCAMPLQNPYRGLLSYIRNDCWNLDPDSMMRRFFAVVASLAVKYGECLADPSLQS